ncbi:nucleolar protein 4-like [Culicoides brevitarsis]|uniref:nucleolar protein 4-like n=1 Tax=Culicoides brevitarsis TaxID=469753 RepID=UPI00307C7B83
MLKDTEKLKLMLLAWNYQNSAAVQNGTDGPDFATMSALWSQYQNALAISTGSEKSKANEQFQGSNDAESRKADTPDENNSSGQKDEDDSEDESEDKMEQSPQDPERLKAFNMFVRLFVDENLDRMIPISKQPKEKVQAIIDSCTRQFPEFSERARKRIRTYLKSCRRNKRTRDGWENTTRPTPAHLTSVQAEQILAIACENESLNVKRMRVGLEPIGHGTDPNTVSLVSNHSQIEPDTVTIPTPANIARISPISNGNANNNQNNAAQNLSSHSMKVQQPSSSSTTSSQIPRMISTSPVNYTIKNETSRDSAKEAAPSTPKNYHNIFANPTNTPTDLSLKRPVFPHKLSQSEILAVKQLITGYRESAAFLLRSADELDQLLQQQ